jgi:glucans biosynthesis protein
MRAAVIHGGARGRSSAARALVALAAACWARVTPAFDLADVAARARALAEAPFRAEGPKLPEAIRKLTYDQYRDIRFRPDRALWRGERLGFEIMFFHRGWSFVDPVKINELTPRGAREVAFDPADFDYGKNAIDPAQLAGLGFAGFRVHFPLNRPDYADETLVFLGASYFRALGTRQRYGVSARGLAIDTAADTGEEFPRFVEIWIERPRPGAAQLTILALLDSPRMTGAYRFELRPGVTTNVGVQAILYPRAKIGKVGVAPLTSMFFFGANQHTTRDDYRPEVHDSDGLLVQSSNGEWLWRPLLNPKRLLVTSFALASPLGFGLMQRERRFARYEDLEARYEMRPSVWVAPEGDWGAGRVELVQIPVPDETNDNIVAYWVPSGAAEPGRPLEYRYRVEWQRARPTTAPLAQVVQTRRGTGYGRGPDDVVELHVDFAHPRRSGGEGVEGVVWVDANGEVVEQHTDRNEATGGWRVVVRVRRRDAGKPVEIRASLRERAEVVSETWSYVLPPD